MNQRFDILARNYKFWGEEKQNKLSESCLLIAGVGGLGCFVTELLVRNGIGELIIVDQGIIDAPDLNRQALYTACDIGRKKVDVAKEKLTAIHDLTKITAYCHDIKDIGFLRDINSRHHVHGLIDCLDNYGSRFILEQVRLARQFLVHGGVAEDYGQVTTINENSHHTLRRLYANMEEASGPIPVSAESVSSIASFMTREALNNLWGEPRLSRSLLILELFDFTISQIPLNPPDRDKN